MILYGYEYDESDGFGAFPDFGHLYICTYAHIGMDFLKGWDVTYDISKFSVWQDGEHRSLSASATEARCGMKWSFGGMLLAALEAYAVVSQVSGWILFMKSYCLGPIFWWWRMSECEENRVEKGDSYTKVQPLSVGMIPKVIRCFFSYSN